MKRFKSFLKTLNRGNGKEKVQHAIVHKGRLVSTGPSHLDAVTKHKDILDLPDYKTMQDKFSTTHGRIVSRKEAWRVHSGQRKGKSREMMHTDLEGSH